MSQQDENLKRVREKVAGAILDFYWIRDEAGQREFHVEELRRYCEHKIGPLAPGSADRIMRDLRQQGLLYYTVLNRKDSLYRIEYTPEAGSPACPEQRELF